MKSKIISIGSIIVIVLLIAVLLKTLSAPTVLPGEKVSVLNLDTVRFWKDKYEREHTVAQVALSNNATLTHYFAPLIDTVLRTLGIQASQLQQISAMTVEAKGKIAMRPDTIYKDGQPYARVTGTDGYLSLTGNTDSLDYSYSDYLTIAGYYKKRPLLHGGLLGKKDLYIDAWLKNPNARISYSRNLQVKDESYDRFLLDGTAGAYHYAGTTSPLAGLAARYYISRQWSIDMSAEYLYSTDLGFQPLITGKARYSLIRR